MFFVAYDFPCALRPSVPYLPKCTLDASGESETTVQMTNDERRTTNEKIRGKKRRRKKLLNVRATPPSVPTLMLSMCEHHVVFVVQHYGFRKIDKNEKPKNGKMNE